MTRELIITDTVGHKYTQSIWWSEAKFLVIHSWIDQKAVLISFHDLSLSFAFSKPMHLKARRGSRDVLLENRWKKNGVSPAFDLQPWGFFFLDVA